MKKEAARMIKTAAAGIAMLAAVICYNMGWNNSAGPAAVASEGSRNNAFTVRTDEETDLPGNTAGAAGDAVDNSENAVGAAGDAAEDSESAAEIAAQAGKAGDAARESGILSGSGGKTSLTEADLVSPGKVSGEEGTAGGKAGRIFIHVCGEVAVPGVYDLEEGSRIYQAIDMAGGFTEDAAKDFLNMAESLEDGMKIQVPNRKEAGEWDSRKAVTYPESTGRTQEKEAAGAGGVLERSNTGTAKVNLNTASKEQLMTLKGIGEARAEAIIAYRQEFGPFTRIEDIMEVSGIKEAAFQKIKEDITV